MNQRQYLPAIGDNNAIRLSYDLKRAPKPNAINSIKPALDREMVSEFGGTAVIDLSANDNRIFLRGRHLRQGESELFRQQSARNFDEAQISNVMDDTTAIGIEKHHLQFRANTWSFNRDHYRPMIPDGRLKATVKQWSNGVMEY